MTDIVERLRKWETVYKIDAHEDGALYNAAADEIERLRKALEFIASPDGSCHDCPDVARDALEGK